MWKYSSAYVIITAFKCILIKCCISQACWMCCKSCPDGMIPGPSLARKSLLSEHAQSSSDACMEHTCSKWPPWLGKCLKKTEVKTRMLLLPELSYLIPDIPSAWDMGHDTSEPDQNQTVCLMSSIVSTHTEAMYILSHTDKEEDYREGICLLHGFCKLFLNTSNAFCQNNAI